MTITVIMFGPAREWTKSDRIDMELVDKTTIAELRKILLQNNPELIGRIASIRFAVNESFADDSYQLRNGDVVAAIPPVSGGSSERKQDLVVLDPGVINMVAIRNHIHSDSESVDGAVCVFEGRVRLEQDATGGSLIALEYEVYDSMALKQLKQLTADAREKWELGSLAVVHRVGQVPVGDASVVIAVTSKHRDGAFEAARWIIDQIKKDVPIWKKQLWAHKEGDWVDPTAT